MVDGKAVDQRPTFYDLVKFAVQKEAEVNFDEAKKIRELTSKPKDTSHFHFNHKKSGMPATPAVQMVAPALKGEPSEGEATPLSSEDSGSAESYEAMQEDTVVSQGEVEIAVRVAQATLTFTGQCFRCNKVGH